ncbi:MAG: D-sedoheptulose-7-phosphate isomerase [Planctomycetota bacterium]|jgi:D-sedoheptulose 7-phosphate isomerase
MNEDTRKKLKAAIGAHKKSLDEFEAKGAEIIAAAAEAIISSLKKGGSVYICGNGGSAADAQHIAGELVGKFERHRKGLPVVALTTDTSVITSLSNDYGYENIFARQAEALVREGDLLWAISTSGASANIIAAAALAKKKGAFVLAFTGKADSKLQQIADICFCTNDDSTARSQEIHQLGYHIICDLVESAFANG